jgi:filamentous hemagglutinin
LNTYGYVRANPLSLVDPRGLDAQYFLPPFSTGEAGGAFVAQDINGSCGCQIRTPDFLNFQLDYFVGSVWGTFSRSGNSFLGVGVNRAYPNPVGAGASITAGWINACTVTPARVDEFLSGYAGSAAAAYGGVGGGIYLSPGNGSATVLGVGAGVTVTGSNVAQPTSGSAVGLGFTTLQGQTGLGGW